MSWIDDVISASNTLNSVRGISNTIEKSNKDIQSSDNNTEYVGEVQQEDYIPAYEEPTYEEPVYEEPVNITNEIPVYEEPITEEYNNEEQYYEESESTQYEETSDGIEDAIEELSEVIADVPVTEDMKEEIESEPFMNHPVESSEKEQARSTEILEEFNEQDNTMVENRIIEDIEEPKEEHEEFVENVPHKDSSSSILDEFSDNEEQEVTEVKEVKEVDKDTKYNHYKKQVEDSTDLSVLYNDYLKKGKVVITRDRRTFNGMIDLFSDLDVSGNALASLKDRYKWNRKDKSSPSAYAMHLRSNKKGDIEITIIYDSDQNHDKINYENIDAEDGLNTFVFNLVHVVESKAEIRGFVFNDGYELVNNE